MKDVVRLMEKAVRAANSARLLLDAGDKAPAAAHTTPCSTRLGQFSSRSDADSGGCRPPIPEWVGDIPRNQHFVNGAAALTFLVDRMVLAAKPSALWLFGSRAREDARPGSDFDFLAIFPDDRSEEIDRLRDRLADAVQGSGIGVDIAVCTETEFESCKTMAGSLIRTVHEEGRKIYEAGGRRRKIAV